MEKLPPIAKNIEANRSVQDELYNTTSFTNTKMATLNLDRSFKNIQNFKNYLCKSKFIFPKNYKTNYTDNQELKNDIYSSNISVSKRFFNETWNGEQRNSN